MQGLAINVETEIVYPLKGIQTTTKRNVYMMQEQGIYCCCCLLATLVSRP